MKIKREYYKADIDFTETGIRVDGKEIAAEDIAKVDFRAMVPRWLVTIWIISFFIGVGSYLVLNEKDGYIYFYLFVALTPLVYWLAKWKITKINEHEWNGIKTHIILVSKDSGEHDLLMKELYSNLRKKGVARELFLEDDDPEYKAYKERRHEKE